MGGGHQAAEHLLHDESRTENVTEPVTNLAGPTSKWQDSAWIKPRSARARSWNTNMWRSTAVATLRLASAPSDPNLHTGMIVRLSGAA